VSDVAVAALLVRTASIDAVMVVREKMEGTRLPTSLLSSVADSVVVVVVVRTMLHLRRHPISSSSASRPFIRSRCLHYVVNSLTAETPSTCLALLYVNVRNSRI